MKTIQNTNITINEGAYFIEYCPSGNSFGERITVMTYDAKKALKKYKSAGYYLFGSPMQYSNGMFYKLTKSLKNSTKNHKDVVIGNAMYHIQKAANNSKITIEP